MSISQLTTALLALVILCVCFSHAVNPIDIRGQQFVNSESNERFMVVGVDYQPGGQGGYKPQDGEDALANATVCLRDAALLQELGVNTIRVYNVGPDINHDECASIFNLAGIYMIIDVNAPFSGESLDRSNPSGSYTADYLERTFGVVEAFKDYPNTLAFFAANEVMNDESNVKENPQYIRVRFCGLAFRPVPTWLLIRISLTLSPGHTTRPQAIHCPECRPPNPRRLFRR